MSLTDDISTPYAISFAINRSCQRQSKALKDLLAMYQQQDLGLGIVSTFLINLLNNVEHYSLFSIKPIGILKVSYQKIQQVGYTGIFQKL